MTSGSVPTQFTRAGNTNHHGSVVQLNKEIGLMITASHNHKDDNGVKIIDPMGEMIIPAWERHAMRIVNADDENLAFVMHELEALIEAPPLQRNACVVVGVDTRESGDWLRDAVEAGAQLGRVSFDYVGRVSTPVMHYIVRQRNDPSYGLSTHYGYADRIGDSFNCALETMKTVPLGNYTIEVHLDTANGIGALMLRYCTRLIGERVLEIQYHNDYQDGGELNANCGADFVKIDQVLPVGFESVPPNSRCASFDGDADRLVYFLPREKSGDIELLDGDKIASLIAKFYIDVGSRVGTMKLLAQNLPVMFVPTGVKHLHHEALKYDIGIYFEANGHGTVVTSENFKRKISKTTAASGRRLMFMSKLLNEIVGDAIADLFAVELSLRIRADLTQDTACTWHSRIRTNLVEPLADLKAKRFFGWSVTDWAKIYEDLPSRQIKVPVLDRSIYRTTPDETRLIEPPVLQEFIDKLTASGDNVRAFVRPSGTENILRVYAEAQNQERTDEIAKRIADQIRQF